MGQTVIDLYYGWLETNLLDETSKVYLSREGEWIGKRVYLLSLAFWCKKS